MIASSILKRDGFDITEIKDGFKGFLDKESKEVVFKVVINKKRSSYDDPFLF